MASNSEMRVIEAVVKFANLSEIRDTAQVQRIFARVFPDESADWIGSVSADAFEKNDRKWVRDLLERIAGRELPKVYGHDERAERKGELETALRREHKRVAAEIAARFEGRSGTVVIAYPALNPKTLRAETVYSVTGVEGAMYLALTLLLDRELRLWERLYQCGHCGRLNFTPTGRPQKYCNAEHRRLANIAETSARRAALRERKAKKRK